MVKIKFIVGGANSAFGGFSAGDMLTCSEAMAKHLVDEVKCAKYIVEPKADSGEESQTLKHARRAIKD